MLSPVSAHRPAVRFGNANLQRDYNNLNKKFQAIQKEAEKHPPTPADPAPKWNKDLQALARSPEANRSVADYVIDANPKAASLLRDEYAKSTLLLEQSDPAIHDLHQKGIVRTDSDMAKLAKTTDYSKLDASFADIEAQASGMGKSANAVFIGSGPQPNTVISYAKYANHVTGIDVDPAAIDATKTLAASSRGRMSFERKDGKAFDYSPYSHVGMAVMIPDKGAVLQQIDRTAAPGTKVIVRSVDGFKRAMYEGLDPAAVKGFNVASRVYGTDRNITHAMILEKKPLDLIG